MREVGLDDFLIISFFNYKKMKFFLKTVKRVQHII